MGVAAAGGTPSLTGEFGRETHRVLECTQNLPTWESATAHPNLLVGSRGSDLKPVRAEQVALFPL